MSQQNESVVPVEAPSEEAPPSVQFPVEGVPDIYIVAAENTATSLIEVARRANILSRGNGMAVVEALERGVGGIMRAYNECMIELVGEAIKKAGLPIGIYTVEQVGINDAGFCMGTATLKQAAPEQAAPAIAANDADGEGAGS